MFLAPMCYSISGVTKASMVESPLLAEYDLADENTHNYIFHGVLLYFIFNNIKNYQMTSLLS